MPLPPYIVDPDDPRAPPQELWDRLTPEDRDRICEALPSEFPVSEANPPEGDPHFEAKTRAREVLGTFVSCMGRKVYLGCKLPVYYPGESMFAPDIMAVMEVEPRSRMRWLVSAEGKGLDLALEVHVRGERRKDLERNVERFARLGIREYFLFDRGRLNLTGWRLEASRRGYRPIEPRNGFFASEVLGLELQLEGERLRFYIGRAPLPEAEEMIATLERMVKETEQHRVEESLRLEEESRRREQLERRLEEESRLRAETERKLAEALAELERLRGGGR